MRIFDSNKFWLVIAVLALGLSVSCGDNNTSNKTNTGVVPVTTGDSPDGNNSNDDTGNDDTVGDTDVTIADVTDTTADVADEKTASTITNFPNVKAYVKRQTCSGEKVLDTWVEVDFSRENLEESEENIIGYAAPYCGTQRCSEMNLKTHGASVGSVVYDNMKLDSLEFRLGDNQSFEVGILPVAPKKDERGRVWDVAYIGGPVRVNFPHIGCDSGLGDIIAECENNPCANTPSSHLCTFNYKRCEVARVDCAAGYLKPNNDAVTPILLKLNGTTFGGKTCVRPVTPIG